MLLAVPKIDANARDKHGDTPLHDIATARRATCTMTLSWGVKAKNRVLTVPNSAQ